MESKKPPARLVAIRETVEVNLPPDLPPTKAASLETKANVVVMRDRRPRYVPILDEAKDRIVYAWKRGMPRKKVAYAYRVSFEELDNIIRERMEMRKVA